MKIKKVVLFLLALVVFLPCLVMANEQEEPTIYIIKRGDTLWGLSERFIKDPHYWPNMWSKNDEITNPHVIYPGQKVKVFSDHLEFVPGETAAKQAAPAAAKAADIFQGIAEERVFTIRGGEGYLLEKDNKPSGLVIGAHNDRITNGVDDIVFTDIGTTNGARGGEKFSIFRDEGPVSHPVTSEIMGRKIIPLGTLQLTDVEQKASRAIITKNFKEISSGSFLLPYHNGRPHEVTLKMATRDLKGYIIESYSGTQIIAAGDIVYIDLGSASGATAGNMLYIVRDVTLDKSISPRQVERLPQELLGALVILETGKKTATALVVKSIDSIYKGDKLISQTK
jgi:hypothetical protein